MKITICGSIAFYDEMVDLKEELEKLGNEIKLPPNEIEDEFGNMISVKEHYNRKKAETNNESSILDRVGKAMKMHFRKIEWGDAVLILNYDKNGIPNYVGGNTLLELGLAFHLNKKLFLLNDIPEMSYKEEIIGMKPVIINKDLTLIHY